MNFTPYIGLVYDYNMKIIQFIQVIQVFLSLKMKEIEVEAI
ncbi:MAG: hypothetical protein ACNI3H_07165 [Halarcobacter ebronensis]